MITLLVIDDEDSILHAFRKAFRPPEFALHTASTSAEGLAQLQNLQVDVVILDVRMPPGIDGVEAGSAIRKLDPNIEIVFVTGFSDVPREELERRVPPPMKLHYFNKPISFMRLAEDVAQMVRSH